MNPGGGGVGGQRSGGWGGFLRCGGGGGGGVVGHSVFVKVAASFIGGIAAFHWQFFFSGFP